MVSVTGRVFRKVLLVGAVATLLLPVAGLKAETVGSRAARGNSASSPWFVFARRGDVMIERANGTGLRQVTGQLQAIQPVLSPDGSRVAFLAGASKQLQPRSVDIISSGAVRGRPRVVYRHADSFNSPLGSMSWSPDGSRLAFAARDDIWVYRVGMPKARVLINDPVIPTSQRTGGFSSLVWSPSSHMVAAQPWYQPAPKSGRRIIIKEMLVTVSTRAQRTREQVYPRWLFGPGGRSGLPWSTPSGLVSWLPSGRLVETTAALGAGNPIDGVWTIPAGGGKARLTLGTVKDNRLQFGKQFTGQTCVVASPHQSRLLMNPYKRLWVGTAAGGAGRYLPIAGRFATTQIAWAGANTVIYVRVAPTNSAYGEEFKASSYSMSLTDGHVVRLAHTQSARQDALSIGLPCTFVGAGA